MGELGKGDGRRHRHLFPPQTTAGLTSLADFFSRQGLFFSFSPNVEPGPRLQKMEARLQCFASILTSTRIFCLNDET